MSQDDCFKIKQKDGKRGLCKFGLFHGLKLIMFTKANIVKAEQKGVINFPLFLTGIELKDSLKNVILHYDCTVADIAPILLFVRITMRNTRATHVRICSNIYTVMRWY